MLQISLTQEPYNLIGCENTDTAYTRILEFDWLCQF